MADIQIIDFMPEADLVGEDELFTALAPPVARTVFSHDFVLTPRMLGIADQAYVDLRATGYAGWDVDLRATGYAGWDVNATENTARAIAVGPELQLGTVVIDLDRQYTTTPTPHTIVVAVTLWNAPGPDLKAPSFDIFGPGGYHRMVPAKERQTFVVRLINTGPGAIAFYPHDLIETRFLSASFYKYPS